jgi:hypothetical protein
MILAGLAGGARKLYVHAVRRLAADYRRSPDLLSEEEARSYLLALRQRGVARGTFQTSHSGLRFYYQHTLGRAWGCSGKKGSPRHGRSGYLTRCRESQIRFWRDGRGLTLAVTAVMEAESRSVLNFRVSGVGFSATATSAQFNKLCQV